MRKVVLSSVLERLAGEEDPRPGPVVFEPKNPEIPELASYAVPPPDSHFDHWPKFEIPHNPYTDVDVKKLEDIASKTEEPRRSRLMAIARKLTFGAPVLVEGLGRVPTFSSNAPTAIAAGARTSDALASQIKKKAIAGPFKEQPFAKLKVNGLMAVERPDGDIRPVLNLSAPACPDKENCRCTAHCFNDGINESKVWPATMASAKTVIAALDSAGRNCRFSKRDMKNAYKLVPVPRRDRYLQGHTWLGRFFVELAGIFGAASACGAFDEFHERILWDIVAPQCDIPHHLVMKTIDDVPAFAPSSKAEWLTQFDKIYNSTCKELGISLAPLSPAADKAFENVTRGVVLGILYDTEKWTWSMTEAKRLRFYHDLKDLSEEEWVTVRFAKSVSGKVQYFTALFSDGRFFRQRLLDLACESEGLDDLVRVTDGLRRDLEYWKAMARLIKWGFPIPPPKKRPPPGCLVYTSDAAGSDGSLNDDRGVASLRWPTGNDPVFVSDVKWPLNIQRGFKAPDGKSMAHKTTTLELVGVLLPLLLDSQVVAGRQVLCMTDNAAVVYTWKKGHCNGDELASTLVRALSHLVSALGVELFVDWVPRNSTPAAALVDALSKGDTSALLQIPDRPATLPRPPSSLYSWLKDPCVDDDLGPRLLREMAETNPELPLLGYSV